MARHDGQQIFTLASGKTKKPIVSGGRETSDPGGRRDGLKTGISVSLGITSTCSPFRTTVLKINEHTENGYGTRGKLTLVNVIPCQRLLGASGKLCIINIINNLTMP
jgi:hypothetical protein